MTGERAEITVIAGYRARQRGAPQNTGTRERGRGRERGAVDYYVLAWSVSITEVTGYYEALQRNKGYFNIKHCYCSPSKQQ